MLTGFLGAGKTTPLNRVLSGQHHRRVGVIINELGRIDIDTRLIKSRSGDVMELAGGCVCHEVRVQSELWAAIAEVNRRSQPGVVVLETTGIAEPWSILDGLEGLGDAAPAVASGVVCAVDAEAGVGQIARHEEARAQIEAADRILLTKLDLRPRRRWWRCTTISPAATRARSAPAFRIPTRRAALFPWLLDYATSRAGPRARPTLIAQPAGGGGLRRRGALLAEPMLAVVEGLGAALVRAKGFVHIAGEPRRGFLERAGPRTALSFGEPWGDDQPATDLVLIGEGLDAGAATPDLGLSRPVSPRAGRARRRGHAGAAVRLLRTPTDFSASSLPRSRPATAALSSGSSTPVPRAATMKRSPSTTVNSLLPPGRFDPFSWVRRPSTLSVLSKPLSSSRSPCMFIQPARPMRPLAPPVSVISSVTCFSRAVAVDPFRLGDGQPHHAVLLGAAAGLVQAGERRRDERFQLVDADRIDVLAAAEDGAQPLHRGLRLRVGVAALLGRFHLLAALLGRLSHRLHAAEEAVLVELNRPRRRGAAGVRKPARPPRASIPAPPTAPPTAAMTTHSTIAQMTITIV